MSSFRACLYSFGLVLSLGGCVGGNSYVTKEEMEDPQASLVYGHINMDEADSAFHWLRVEQVHPKTDDRFWPFTVREGYFYHEALPPGSYRMGSFGSGHEETFGGTSRYNFSPQMGGARIKTPGLHFWGSWACSSTGPELFESEGEFSIEETNSPTELETLQFLLTKLEGTRWEEPILARIKALSK